MLHPCGFFHTPEWQSCLIAASAVDEIHLPNPKSSDYIRQLRSIKWFSVFIYNMLWYKHAESCETWEKRSKNTNRRRVFFSWNVYITYKQKKHAFKTCEQQCFVGFKTQEVWENSKLVKVGNSKLRTRPTGSYSHFNFSFTRTSTRVSITVKHGKCFLFLKYNTVIDQLQRVYKKTLIL